MTASSTSSIAVPVNSAFFGTAGACGFADARLGIAMQILGQGIVPRERFGEGRDWLIQQVEDRALNRPPQRLR